MPGKGKVLHAICRVEHPGYSWLSAGGGVFRSAGACGGRRLVRGLLPRRAVVQRRVA